MRGRLSAKRAQQRDRELQEELQAVRLRIVELEEVLKSAREALDAARDRRGELSAAQARVQSDVQHMAETCIQELSQQRDELMADTSLPRVAGEELISEDGAYREMRTRLDNMGPVNMMALEEYKETAAAASSSWRRSGRTCCNRSRTRRIPSKRSTSSRGRSSKRRSPSSTRTSARRSASSSAAARASCG